MSESLSYLQMRAVIDSALEGIITINQNGEIVTMNPSAEKIFGYSHHEALCKNVRILVPKRYRHDYYYFISNQIRFDDQQPVLRSHEFVGIKKNGQEFPLLLSISAFVHDASIYYSGFFRDVTIEKLNLQKARSYKHILENSVNEIYIFDAESLKFIHVNQGALKNLNYTPEELHNKTPLDLKPAFDEFTFKELINPLLRGDVNKITFSTVQQRKDETTYPVEVHLELTEYINTRAFIAIIIDITDKVKSQEKIRLHENMLTHLDRISIFGEMAAGIAHELNQPLAAINAYTNAGINRLKKDDFDIDKIIELFEKVGKASDRASEIITRLKVNLKSHSTMMKSIVINNLLVDTVELIQLDSRSKNFSFILKLADNLPDVVADPVQIQQVLLNLLRNSIDATDVSDNIISNIVITTSMNTQQQDIIISISDAGRGISTSDEEKVFTPFFTTKDDGLGVGLSICQTIIHSHSGKLWYTSNPDCGVTFHFSLHAAPLIQ